MNDKIKLLDSMHVRASVQPDSISVEDRTVDVVFSSGYKGERRDWFTGRKWYESLSLDSKHVNLDRLNAGAPALDSHSAYRVGSVIGVVESAETDGKRGVAKIRFSDRDEVKPIFQDIKDGILRNVSVGYKVNKFEDVTEKGEEIRHLRAVDWTPVEISIVPIGFDPDAQVRASGDKLYMGDQAQLVREVEIIQRTERSNTLPDKEKTSVGTVPTAPAQRSEPQGTPQATEPAKTPDNAAEITAATEKAKREERARAEDIRGAVRKGGLDEKFADELIADDSMTLERAFRAVVDKFAERGQKIPQQQNGHRMSFGQDETETRMQAVEGAILARIDASAFPIKEKSFTYRGMSLLEISRRILEWGGADVKNLGKNELAQRALTGSDFPLIVENIATKTLLAGFKEPPQTFNSFVRVVEASNFKEMSRVKLGEAPQLKKVKEHGEITYGSIEEGGEKYAIATYAKGTNLSRKLLIDDDLSAMGRVPRAFGRQANNLESDLIWNGIIIANPTMADGEALFSAAHGNLADPGSVLSDDSINDAFVAMMTHLGLDGKTHISIVPENLVVPVALWRDARKFMTAVLSTTADDANIWAGKFGIVTEQRLDAASVDAWYLFSSLAGAGDMIELAVLDGIRRPQITTVQRGGVDGISIEIIYDIGAKAIEYRGFYSNEGA